MVICNELVQVRINEVVRMGFPVGAGKDKGRMKAVMSNLLITDGFEWWKGSGSTGGEDAEDDANGSGHGESNENGG